MKAHVKVEASRHPAIDGQPAHAKSTHVTVTVRIDDAMRGEPVVGVIDKALDHGRRIAAEVRSA